MTGLVIGATPLLPPEVEQAPRAETTPDPGELTREYSAHNYAPLPIVVESADGVWVTDVQGRRYLDMLAGYSALNFGHGTRGLSPRRSGSWSGSRW